MEELICTKCGDSKPIDDFRRRKQLKRGYQSWCKVCERLANNKRTNKRYVTKPKRIPASADEIKSKAKNRMLKHRYDLTREEYEHIYHTQGHKCVLCLKDSELGTHTGLHVDHCHVTNKVRGLLCSACNTALGKFKDDIEILERAIDYLKLHVT